MESLNWQSKHPRVCILAILGLLTAHRVSTAVNVGGTAITFVVGWLLGSIVVIGAKLCRRRALAARGPRQ